MVVAAFALDDYLVYEKSSSCPGMILPFPFLHYITKAVSKNRIKTLRIQSFGTPGIIGIAVSVTWLRRNPTRRDVCTVQSHPDVDKRASES